MYLVHCNWYPVTVTRYPVTEKRSLEATESVEFVGIKVRRIYENFALKKLDKTPPSQLQFSQVTEKFTDVVEA